MVKILIEKIESMKREYANFKKYKTTFINGEYISYYNKS